MAFLSASAHSCPEGCLLRPVCCLGGGGQSPETLAVPDTLQCPGRPPAQSDLNPNVHSAEGTINTVRPLQKCAGQGSPSCSSEDAGIQVYRSCFECARVSVLRWGWGWG